MNINPFGYVPSVTIDGFTFSESMASASILKRDTLTLHTRNDPNEKTLIRRVGKYVNSTIHSPQNKTVLTFMRLLLNEDTKRELRGEWIMHCLEKLRRSICMDSGYMISNSFSLADIFCCLDIQESAARSNLVLKG